ncbi:hypothetical protein QQ045_006340 [Rhodiola kirilowii]
MLDAMRVSDETDASPTRANDLSKPDECVAMEVEDHTEESKIAKKLNKVAKDSGDVRNIRMIKQIDMSLTTPSYVLGLGNDKVRAHNRSKLYSVLRKLVRRQNWKEASGVLNLVLRATTKDMCPRNNRIKYWTAMELVKQCKQDRVEDIEPVFNIWIKKFRKATGSAHKESIVLQLDFIRFLLTVQGGNAADLAARDLLQMRNFDSNPLSHMILGLTYYQCWYAHLPPEELLTKTDIIETHVESDQSGQRFDGLIRHSVGHSMASNNELENQHHYDSETSVMVDKKILHEVSHCEGRSAEMCGQRQPFQSQGFYLDSENSEDEENVDCHIDDKTSVFANQGLDPWLLPLKLPAIKGYKDFSRLRSRADDKVYKRAVEHLRLALCARPPVIAALVPLVQLLLLGDQVGKALQELEKFSSDSGTELAFRLKASILEHIDHSNYKEQISCYEGQMKKDPTCSHALGKLISLHREGEYESESLIEMIALHLDATFADYHTWKEFAVCFLELSRLEEDRLSICQDGDEHQHMQGVVTMRIPIIFKDTILSKNWIFRCKWWLNRHFGKKMCQEEIATGNLELLTYKAACASHMYGCEFEYVQNVHSFLARHEEKELLHFLQMHRQHSIGLYLNLVQKPAR